MDIYLACERSARLLALPFFFWARCDVTARPCKKLVKVTYAVQSSFSTADSEGYLLQQCLNGNLSAVFSHGS